MHGRHTIAVIAGDDHWPAPSCRGQVAVRRWGRAGLSGAQQLCRRRGGEGGVETLRKNLYQQQGSARVSTEPSDPPPPPPPPSCQAAFSWKDIARFRRRWPELKLILKGIMTAADAKVRHGRTGRTWRCSGLWSSHSHCLVMLVATDA